MRPLTDLRIVAADLDHPEAVAWHDGRVWCGTEGGDLLAIDAQTGAVEVAARTGGLLLGIAFDGVGRCWACDARHGRVLRIAPGGEVESVVEAVEGRRLRTPNFGAFDRDGTLWMTESGRFGADDGYLFAVGRDGAAVVADERVAAFPNGLAFSADGETLYVAESARERVVALRVGDRALAPAIELTGTVPDGLAVDRDGTLYVGCWRPDRVYRCAEGSRPEILLDDPRAVAFQTATNLCFGGLDLRTLFVAGIGGRVVTALRVETAGAPLGEGS